MFTSPEGEDTKLTRGCSAHKKVCRYPLPAVAGGSAHILVQTQRLSFLAVSAVLLEHPPAFAARLAAESSEHHSPGQMLCK